jgi:hypothetical protein
MQVVSDVTPLETVVPIQETPTDVITSEVPAVAVVKPRSYIGPVLAFLLLVVVALMIWLFTHHSTPVVSTGSTSGYVTQSGYPGYSGPVRPVGASSTNLMTDPQSALSSAPGAIPEARGGLTTHPGTIQYTSQTNPNCQPDSYYWPACQFTDPRTSAYNPNPQCVFGSRYFPLCLVTSTHTNPAWQ